jgi:hypothetical protein
MGRRASVFLKDKMKEADIACAELGRGLISA